MINDRSTHTESLLATDQVFEGATIRDRFLTAFILRNAGSFVEVCTAEHHEEPAPYFGDDALCLSLQLPTERAIEEPLSMNLIEEWFLADGEDDV